MSSSIEMKLLVKDIVGSKGYHVYKMWSHEKKDVDSMVESLNSKINKDTRSHEPLKIENPEKSVFLQKQFEF